jgi:hypothetical protein
MKKMNYDPWRTFALGLFVKAHELTDNQLKDTKYLEMMEDLYSIKEKSNEL